MLSIGELETCPRCRRNRFAVAESFCSDHPVLKRGVQVALGGRVSCVECGLEVLARRDARAAGRHPAQQSAEALLASLMSQCRGLAERRRRLASDLDTIRSAGWWRRLAFILTGRM